MYKIIGADQKEYGPISIDQMRQWITEGRINAQTLVWSEASGNWKPLSAYEELTGLAPAAGGPTIAPTTPPPRTAFTGGAATAQPRPPNYLVQAILVTLCCCLPFGIAAIVFSAQVNSKYDAGDYAGALESSKKAKMWCWIAFGVGIPAAILGIIVQILGVAAQHQ